MGMFGATQGVLVMDAVPQERRGRALGLLSSAIGVLPVGMFALGVAAYRGDWLQRLPTSTGVIWMGIGLVASAGVFATQLAPPERVGDFLAFGGSDARSLLYSTWEALICVGMVVGMIVVFRAVFRRTNRLLAAMVAVSYAAYILHLAIVIGVQFAIEGVDLPVLIKFGIVTAAGVALAVLKLTTRLVPLPPPATVAMALPR